MKNCSESREEHITKFDASCVDLKILFGSKFIKNKKVLLHERKRHTARCVASTPYVVLTGYPLILTWPGGVPDLGTPARVPPWEGTPLTRVPPREGTPLPGYPPTRVPPWAGYPPSRVPPRLDLAGYPPRYLPHGILGNVAKHYGIWVPHPRCGQTNKVKLLPSRRTTYAGGN